jgi:hypothetical protein
VFFPSGAPDIGAAEITRPGASRVPCRASADDPWSWATPVDRSASASLPARTIVAVAANAIVSAVDGSPAIDASNEAEFVRDTVPTDIVTASGTVATSVGSLFQTDQISLRLRWPLSFALRSSAGLAWMSGVNW